MVKHSTVDREGVGPVIAGLAEWYAGGGYSTGVHPGDLGWHLRMPDIADQVNTWWDGDDLVAVALVEGVVARPQVRPDRTRDHGLAAVVADVLERMPGDDVWSDSAPGALHQELVRRGWTLDPDPWVSLFAEGHSWQAPEPVEAPSTRGPRASPSARRRPTRLPSRRTAPRA